MDAVRAANARILADAREPKDLVVAIEFRVARIFSDTAKTYSAQESSWDSSGSAPHTTIQTDRKHPSLITYVGSCQGIELSDLVRAYVVAGIRIRLGHYQGIVPPHEPALNLSWMG